MTNGVLVTGAGNFLGYHVIKQLDARGVRPRVLIDPDAEASAGLRSLDSLDVERVGGSFGNPDSLDAACSGMDTVLHLHFLIDWAPGRRPKPS